MLYLVSCLYFFFFSNKKKYHFQNSIDRRILIRHIIRAKRIPFHIDPFKTIKEWKSFILYSKLDFFRVRTIQIILTFDYLVGAQKNFLNSRQKEISLTQKPLTRPTIPSFSKNFYEYAFLTQKYVFLELPFKN